MGLGEAVIVAGIGCRKDTSAGEIAAAIDAALAQARCSPEMLGLIATSEGKGGEPGIADAAAARGVPLIFIAQTDLEAAAPRAQTHSARVQAVAGLPSVAETAALAAAGPEAQLLLPRIVVGTATCALAGREDTP